MNKKVTIPLLSVASVAGIIFAGTLDDITYRGELEGKCVKVFTKSILPMTAKVELTITYSLPGYSGLQQYGPVTNETPIDSKDSIVLTACTKGEYQGHSFKVSKK